MLIQVQEHRTMHSFQETLNAVLKAIGNAGMIVFSEVDHAKAARDNGLAMPETRVILYGNPKVGTPAMLDTPIAALDLPLRLLVRELPGGRAAIAFHPITDMFEAMGVKAQDAERFDMAQNLIAKAVVGAKPLPV